MSFMMMINTVPSYSVSFDVMMISSSDRQENQNFEADPLLSSQAKTYESVKQESSAVDKNFDGKASHLSSLSPSPLESSPAFELAKQKCKDSETFRKSTDSCKKKCVTVFGDDVCSLSSLNSAKLLKNQNFQTNPLRVFVLLFYCLTSFAQVVISNTWGPIADSVLFAYPTWKPNVITLLANWSSLTLLVFICPACWLLNKKGLRYSFIVASGLSCVGAGIRCLSLHPSIFVWLMHSCAILNAMAGVLLGPSIVMLSSLWFPPNERTTATGVGTALSLLGMAGSYQLGPIIVHTEPPASKTFNHSTELQSSGAINDEIDYLRASIRMEIRQFMLICFAFEVFIFIGMILVFPDKPLLPSSRASCISVVYRISFVDSLRSIVRNRNVWALCISAGLCTGMTVPWVSLLTIIFSHKHIPQTVAAQLGVWTIICTCFLGLSVSRFSDMFQGHLKLTLLVFLLLSALMFIGILLLFLYWNPDDQGKLLLLVLLGISTSWSTQALFYELGSEIAYPVPEGIVAGFMTWLSSLCTAVVYLFLYTFPNVDDMWLTYGAVVYNIGAFITLLSVKESYKRSAMDKEE